MKKKVKYILSVVAAVAAVSAYAQDARIAHPFLWESYYNPAYCGSDGLLKIDAGAQTSFTYQPNLFLDSHFSSEIGIAAKNVSWGVGLKANNEYQGNGLLNVASLNPVVSVGLALYDKYDVISTLRVGMSADIVASHINKSKMVFTDQLDPFYGKVLPESAELAYINNETVWSGDMSAGIYGQTSVKRMGTSMPIIINYGFSVAHIIGSGNQSFYDGQRTSLYMPSLYYRRFSAQLEYSHPYETKKHLHMYFTTYGIYEYQGGMNDIQFGFVYKVHRFMVGLSFKVQQYNSFTLSNILFHFVYSQPLNNYALMRIAYSFETPMTQGSVTQTSIHSLSLHFAIDYEGLMSKRNKCRHYTRPSDAAWYEMGGTFPAGN